jgi:protein ImuA
MVMTNLSPQRAEIVASLQTDILRLQGFRAANSAAVDHSLGPIRQAFPKGSFPIGCVHEFLSDDIEAAAATNGFVSGLLAPLMVVGGPVLWISASRMLFPPALKHFGLYPDQFIFIDLQKEKEVLWAMDEALKCGALSAVVGELQELSFTASRRLQLAVEHSQVTGFVLRRKYRQINTTACVSRWKITPLPSLIVDDLPGVGYPQWKVELLRIRNGRPGVWEVPWISASFRTSETSGQALQPRIIDPEQHEDWA